MIINITNICLTDGTLSEFRGSVSEGTQRTGDTETQVENKRT